MLVIRLNAGWTLKLDRQIGSAGKAGLWDFHRSESSYTVERCKTYRTAATKPAEPKEGQTVEVFICDQREPEEKWRAVGEGVARYQAEQ
ncbi:hypothetical protein [Pseudomonas sp. TCU-HL1]|uniref:hypothetical protein n=1 Tax=Pseudomonas sp. TCU-HL1 TaxID=1856685 RepID=UPI00083DD3DF|nr:hypothetical protein [Pseudomonas sp. TCU-HL1]AOE86113.1 hypothetical protein THL1_3565 [Pseudomonas sp. TCU-HL1]